MLFLALKKVRIVKITLPPVKETPLPSKISFYLVVKRLMITKNSDVKIQNLVVNHESRPIKSNPEMFSDVFQGV